MKYISLFIILAIVGNCFAQPLTSIELELIIKKDNRGIVKLSKGGRLKIYHGDKAFCEKCFISYVPLDIQSLNGKYVEFIMIEDVCYETMSLMNCTPGHTIFTLEESKGSATISRTI